MKGRMADGSACPVLSPFENKIRSLVCRIMTGSETAELDSRLWSILAFDQREPRHRLKITDTESAEDRRQNENEWSPRPYNGSKSFTRSCIPQSIAHMEAWEFIDKVSADNWRKKSQWRKTRKEKEKISVKENKLRIQWENMEEKNKIKKTGEGHIGRKIRNSVLIVLALRRPALRSPALRRFVFFFDHWSSDFLL